MTSLAESIFTSAFEIAPIWLVGGLADYVGGYVPITLLTEIVDLPGLSSKEFFAHYKPLPGGTLAKWQVAEYPFANFATAANAVVQKPLEISMLMVCPAQTGGGYLFKTAIFNGITVCNSKTHYNWWYFYSYYSSFYLCKLFANRH
jgi:hypothetical protein